MRANVKPLVHWAIYKGYKVRYSDRSPAKVTGILTTANGEQSFHFDPEKLTIKFANQQVTINQHGWELSQDAQRADHVADQEETTARPDNPEEPR